MDNQQNWQLPIHVSCVAANGGMTYLRYVADEAGVGVECHILTGYRDGDVDYYRLPIHMMFAESGNNHAAYAVMEPPKSGQLISHPVLEWVH
jgi:hypothetical protein